MPADGGSLEGGGLDLVILQHTWTAQLIRYECNYSFFRGSLDTSVGLDYICFEYKVEKKVVPPSPSSTIPVLLSTCLWLKYSHH